ncbi:MAG: hypothetical protein KME10_01700 [Plectolyngbya sp. WJT66-NPBG17]|nr:hypothetical protein [Plectolyngbya sp. WJT66-NPBG17]MBW4523894.1 hypothetical protein [Phormidium tanganyikae FI6-MK23]
MDRSIWSQLRQVDRFTVILMRHALAPGTGDPSNFQLDNCSTQRNLSKEGKKQAKQIGQVFRRTSGVTSAVESMVSLFGNCSVNRFGQSRTVSRAEFFFSRSLHRISPN